jgi:hypothetical protein
MGDAPTDKRIDFLRDRIVQLLKCKPELFDALLKTEEGELIKRFLNDGGCTRIFFSAGPKDMFVTEKLPDDKQTKKKAIFAMKLAEDVKFDEKKMDEMFDLCMVGDLSPAMLNNLYNTLRSVYLPIITNPGFINAKPGVVMKQFIDKYNWMLAAVHTAVGQTQGKTALWLPPVEAPSAGSSKDRSDKDRVHVLESAIVMWTERINTVRRSPSPHWLRLPLPGIPPRAPPPCSCPSADPSVAHPRSPLIAIPIRSSAPLAPRTSSSQGPSWALTSGRASASTWATFSSSSAARTSSR